MKKRKVIITVVVAIFILLGIFAFKKYYIPYDKDKQMYKVFEGENFVYYSCNKDDKEKTKELNEYIEPYYDNLLSKFGLKEISKIDVKIFESSELMTEGKYYRGIKISGIAMAKTGEIGLVSSKIYDMKRVLKHELVHIIISNVNPKDMINKNDWLQEGTADYYSSPNSTKDLSVVVSTMTDNLPDLDFVLNDNNFLIIREEWNYSLYKSIVTFIIDKYGQEELINIMKNIGEKDVYEILNTNKEEFEIEWKAFILENK